jgi:hypothetical protein
MKMNTTIGGKKSYTPSYVETYQESRVFLKIAIS